MVQVLHEELECKVEKLKYKKLEVLQPSIKKKIRTSSWWITILDQSTRTFAVASD